MKVNRAKYETLVEELEKLRELSEDTPIVVEGKNDEKSLRKLGIEGEIYHIHTGMPLYEVCERIAEKHKDVILFTDTDKKGHELARRFKSHMSQNGVRVNDHFRASLMGKLDTHQVEHLFRRLARVREQFTTFK